MSVLKYISVTIIAVATFGLVGCGGGGGGGGGGVVIVEDTWYNVFGEACGDLAPGCAWVDQSSDLKADWWDDPYYSEFEEPMWATVFDDELGLWVDAYGYFGYNDVFYDYYTWRAINEDSPQKGRDLLSQVGMKEEALVETIGKQFADRYKLDAKVGVDFVRELQNFNKIAKTRSRTDADVEKVVKTTLNVELADLKKAVIEDNEALKAEIVSDAAQKWNTTPETMKTIVKDLFNIEGDI
jgi:hypothetical protein